MFVAIRATYAVETGVRGGRVVVMAECAYALQPPAGMAVLSSERRAPSTTSRSRGSVLAHGRVVQGVVLAAH
jgi:hypothetical protein